MGVSKKLAVIMLLLLAVTLIAGCVQQESSGTTIKNQAEASDRITNISQNIENVGQALSDIDKKLG